MKSTLLLFCLLVVGFPGQSQDSLVQAQSRSIWISLDLPPILDPYSPRYRLGLLTSLSDDILASLHLGIGGADFVVPKESMGSDYQFFEIRPEIRYLLHNQPGFQFFSSLEPFFLSHRDHYQNMSFYDGQDHYTYDFADFSRMKTGLNLKMGILAYFGSMGIEFYCGGGVAHRVTSFDNLVNLEKDNDSYSGGWLWSDFRHFRGNKTYPNLTGGIRLLYRL
jgi:hypothetical protein